MNIETASNADEFYDKLLNTLRSLKDGEGLTKTELAKLFNFTSDRVVEKWMNRYPKIKNHRLYLQMKNGTANVRTTIFVNENYRKHLIENGKGTERY